MKSIKFLTFAVVSLCAVFFVASCSKDDDGLTVLKFSPAKTALLVGGTQNVTVTGGTAPYKVTVSDQKLATAKVDKNVITLTGVKAGKVNVVVTDQNKKTGTFMVEVKEMLAEKSMVEVKPGKEMAVKINGGTAPYTATVKDMKVATATVDGAKVTIKGVKAGKTTVTVTDKNKLTTMIAVTVK